MKKLKKELDNCINKYVELFEKKHEIEFNFWIRNIHGSVAIYSDFYSIDFLDIRLDLEKDVPKDKFFDWYELTLELAMKSKPIINYSTFLKTNC